MKPEDNPTVPKAEQISKNILYISYDSFKEIIIVNRKITKIESDKKKISVSVKHLTEDPYSKIINKYGDTSSYLFIWYFSIENRCMWRSFKSADDK